jgi:peptidoglycan/xylan/chitin deacetylase (PgdA/CDA1 family)
LIKQNPLYLLVLWYLSIPKWIQKCFPSLVWQAPSTKEAVVYLTFDDGPHPEITPWVLNELKQRGLKASFFCVGDNVRKFPETYQQILNEGHITGNHTMHHMKGWSNSTETYTQNTTEAAQYIKSKLFRPPYGRISRAQIKALLPEYTIVMWSLLSGDFNPQLNIPKALNQIKRKTQNGSIVVFHDSIKSEAQMKQLLPDYLDYLIANAYTCKTL